MAAGILLAAWVGACASVPERIDAPLPDLSRRPARSALDTWPLPPAEAIRRLEREDFMIRASEGAGAGVTGASKMTLFFPARGEELVVKWKPVPRGKADGWNNSPRKELAVYAVQKWFLDPEDYVVPATVARCVPLDVYRQVDSDATANIEGTRCVLGVMAVWLKNVTVPDRLFEPSRFFGEASYAYHMAHFNLLTYLVEHQDGRRGNFLVAKDDTDRRVFSVDNGISFGALVHNFLVRNWDRIRVPALRRESIERLRAIRRSDIDRLGVLVEMKTDPEGILRPVPPGANLDPSRGARVRPGWVQLGLDQSERDALERRIRTLLEKVDRGEIPTAQNDLPGATGVGNPVNIAAWRRDPRGGGSGWSGARSTSW